MNDHSLSRRTVLKAGASSVAAATSLAGCTDALDTDSSSSADTGTSFFPAKTELPDEVSVSTFQFTSPATFKNDGHEETNIFVQSVPSEFLTVANDSFETWINAYNTTNRSGALRIALGDFDTESVRTEIEESDTEPESTTEIGDWTHYAAEGAEIALTDGGLLASRANLGETALQSNAGAVDTAYGTNAAFATHLDYLDIDSQAMISRSAGSEGFEEQVDWLGRSIVITDDDALGVKTSMTVVGDDPQGTYDEFIAGNYGSIYEDPTVEIDGDAVLVDETLPMDLLR